ncbi:hypothetical protein PTT_13402 [Pyrenophora teres f. teres 0-1]|uniref:Uncharacterized protein n=1 Tax=Pyrenophora teres f. teres (strain 0-1) TaxID=861557 RepID=E3RW05_PYRTT|nr:hypothetical protein PTT_13402 [Pyrenophora teres f. teres 0-1]
MASSRKRKATDIPEPSTSKKARNTDGNEWEIMDGDGRDTILPGTPQPNRLKMKFRHKTTNIEKNLTYQKKEAKDINWDSKEDIHHINKWRSSIFLQKGFPPLVEKLSWAPTEKGYLELFLERVALAVKKDNSIVLPDKEVILETFNEYFDGRSDLRDAKGHELPARHTSNGDEAYMPEITDDEIEAYLANGLIASNSISEESSSGIENMESLHQMSPTNKDEIYNSHPPAGQSNKPTTMEQALEEDTTGRTEATGLSIEASRSAENQTFEDVSTSTADNDLLANSVPGVTNSQASPHLPQAVPSSSTGKKKKSRNQRPVIHRSSTPPEEIARQVADGWIIPYIPQSDEEALQLHREKSSKKPYDLWYARANHDLSKRLADYGGFPVPGPERNAFSRGDRKLKPGEISFREGEDFHKNSARKEGSAAVNALLNYTLLPPVGYTGPLDYLWRHKLLPKEELDAREASEIAIKRLHDNLPEDLKNLRDIDEDSDETVEEDANGWGT